MKPLTRQTSGLSARCAASAVVLSLTLLSTSARAETSEAARERRPELFHPETGYRIERHRAPTPDDVPSGRVVDAKQVAALDGAVLIDVFGAAQSRFDELDGTWLIAKTHLTLPGATWLPEVGRGALEPTMRRYFADNLERLTDGCRDRTLVFFCVADCWMSWNAAQRAAVLGYRDILWFRDGTDGWLDAGFDLVPAKPIPVAVD